MEMRQVSPLRTGGRMMYKYLKNRVLFLSTVIVFVFSSLLVAGEESQFTLDKQGIFRHKTENFEVRMLENGNIEIYSEGRRLADGDAYAGNFPLSSPEVTADEEKLEYILKQTRACKDGNTVFRIRKMRAVGDSIELTTVFKASGGKSVTHYTPKKSGYAERFRMRGSEYDGGKWKFGDKTGRMQARKKPVVSNSLVWEMFPGASGYPVEEASFWQKGRRLGFSLKNTPNNRMWLVDKGKADRNNIPQAAYLFKMFAIRGFGEKTMVEEKALQTTLIISPAYQNPEDLGVELTKDRTILKFPVKEREGYFSVNYSLPIEITILPSKETAGTYRADFFVQDQTNSEILSKRINFNVTEKEEGKAKFDFVTPKQCALYWLSIIVKDKNNNDIINCEYPFATTVQLPALKDLPLSAPIAGQPVKLIPEGRFYGMKWDRFWNQPTSWCNIEPEKGKFNWEECDRWVDESIKAGHEILWCLSETPDWASSAPKDKIYDMVKANFPVSDDLVPYLKTRNAKRIPRKSPPKDIKDWENFVRTIVRRYKDRVHYWQIWNEPWWWRKQQGTLLGDNLMWQIKWRSGKVIGVSGCGFGAPINEYVKLVKSAYKIIHEEDTQAKVVVFSDYVMQDSMEDFYKLGVGEYIDILSLHYFEDRYLGVKKDTLMSNRATRFHKEKLKIKDTSFILSNNDARDFDRIHFKYTGKHVPIWNTEEGGYTLYESYTGRKDPRPLSDKEVEALYGKTPRWIDRQWLTISERRSACWMIQGMLFQFAVGIDKVFLHHPFGASISSGAGDLFGVDPYHLPTDRGIALAALAREMITKKNVEFTPVGKQKVDAVTITRDSGEKTAVLWAHTLGEKIPVYIPAGRKMGFEGMDFLGNPISFKTEKGWLNLEVGEEPIYIYGLDLAPLFTNDRYFISMKDMGEIETLAAGKAYKGEITVNNPYAGRNIEGILEAHIEGEGRILFDADMLKLPPGEERTIPFSILAKGYKSFVDAEIVLKEKSRVLGTVKKKYSMRLPVPKALTSVKVDGDAGEWKDIAGAQVNTAERVVEGLEIPAYEVAPIRIWKGPDDLSFTVKTCWEPDKALYVLIDVQDNLVKTNKRPSYKWDCVEIFVDVRDIEEQANKEKTPGALRLLVKPCVSEEVEKCQIKMATRDKSYVHAFFRGKKTERGYLIEGRIVPQEKSAFQLKQGAYIGLDVAVDDGEEPNVENKAKRKSRMVWLGTEDNYKNTSGWGRFCLVE